MKKKAHYVQQENQVIKLGIGNHLFLTTHDNYIDVIISRKACPYKDGLAPEAYLAPDSSFYFRFPFPEEEGFSIETTKYVGRYKRLAITLESTPFISRDLFPPQLSELGDYFRKLAENKKVSEEAAENITLEIAYQKVITNKMDGNVYVALVLRCPNTRQELLVQHPEEMDVIVQQIYKHHVLTNQMVDNKLYWTSAMKSILAGYVETSKEDYKRLIEYYCKSKH